MKKFIFFKCMLLSHLPVSLEYMIGGGRFASPKFRGRGYLVLVNRCNTIQIRPVSTAMPVATPSRVGRSEFNSFKSMFEGEN